MLIAILTFHDILIGKHRSSLCGGEPEVGKTHGGGEAEGDCEPAQAASDEPPNSLEWTGKLLVPSKVLCSYIQICEHIQPLLVHYFIPGHAVKMNTAVCNFPFGLEFVNQKVGVGRLQIACNYWAEKLKGGSSICNLGCQGEKCNLSCPVLAAMCCSYLTLTLSQNESHSENILSCLYLQRLGRYRRLPIGLVAKHSPKITNYVNDSEDKST